MLWLSLACTPDEPPVTSPEPDSTADTGTPTSDTGTPLTLPDVLEAACVREPNALRARCTVTLAEPGPARVTLSADAATTRGFVSLEPVLEHELLIWGPQADTAYTWVSGEASGELLTGSLPSSLVDADVEVTGTLTAIDAVLRPMACPDTMYFVMFESDGDIVWFEEVAEYGANGFGYDWSVDEQTLLATNMGLLQEIHVSGEERLRLEQGVHFTDDLHHDVARWENVTYLLIEDGLLDRVEAFEGETLLGSFELVDHFSLGFRGAHSNGLNLGPDGTLALSSLVYDTIIGLDGDPASSTFMQLIWTAAGNPAEGFDEPPDFVPADAVSGFSGQHNARRLGDELWVFDNTGIAGRSRALKLALDEATGTMTRLASWPFDEACGPHGGAYPLDDGGVLTTCATSDRVWAFGPKDTEPAWTLQADCGATVGLLGLTKGIPITIE